MPLNNHKQTGYIALSLMLVVVMAGTSFMLSAFNSRVDSDLERLSETRRALQQAKQELLQYAANYTTLSGNTRGPGFLPCPDTDNNGVAESSCSGNNMLGRLPTSISTAGAGTYEISSYRKSADENFWYQVSLLNLPFTTTNYAYYRTGANWPSYQTYRYSVDGSEQNVIAVIIAPGAVLSGQNRTGGPTNVANYLEGENADRDFFYANGDSINSDTANDLIETITIDDMMRYMGTAVATEFLEGFLQYYSVYGVLPPNQSTAANYLNSYFGSQAHPWIRNTGGQEYWPTNLAYTTSNQSLSAWYQRDPMDPAKASFSFFACNGMVFSISSVAGSKVTRTGDHCTP